MAASPSSLSARLLAMAPAAGPSPSSARGGQPPITGAPDAHALA